MFSTFVGRSSPIEQAKEKRITAAVDTYESDFGKLKIVPDRHMETDMALVLDMEYWKVAFVPGRNMATWDLAKTGDTDRKQILCEFTLEACNEKSSGICADLTNS